MHDWHDAERLDAYPGETWVKRLLRGIRSGGAAAASRKLSCRQHEGGHDIHGRLQRGPWRLGHVGADGARGQDRRRLAGAALAGAHSSRHARERLGHDDHNPAARATLDDVMNQSKEGQSWILLWDLASIHASESAKFPHVVLCFIPPHSTSYLQSYDVAVFRSFKSCIQVQASATLAAPSSTARSTTWS